MNKTGALGEAVRNLSREGMGEEERALWDRMQVLCDELDELMEKIGKIKREEEVQKIAPLFGR